MKILIDMNLSPAWVGFLEAQGFVAVHWSDVGDPRAPDRALMSWAREHGHVVFTHDLDFSVLLATRLHTYHLTSGSGGGRFSRADRPLHHAGLHERPPASQGSTHYRAARELNLSNNAIGRTGCDALASCRGLEHLSARFLHGCALGDDDVVELLASPVLFTARAAA